MATFSTSMTVVDLAIDPLITCRLCLSEYAPHDMYTLQDCGCIYCKECVQQYVMVMIYEGNVVSITCPDAQCRKQGKILFSEVKTLVDEKHFARYRKLKFQKEVDLDPDRTFCPEAGCETVCHVCSTSSSQAFSKPTPVDCPKCKLQFCSVCKSKWHHTKSCNDVVMSGRLEDQGIPFTSEAESNIKRCPVCHVPIERNDGCAQMMCKRCKHVFCWYCLTSLDDDFLLRHYDKGPCKNKLGHSRASVIWHRTQVIGIFAGFGVLLLVASPFLLLAAPCILCCKCSKVSKCCSDDDDDPVAANSG
ncbi:probable E3 ubiquitin-protein ligase RNF144A [Dreissena polymorpha]|uniref:probable E3 ubiquitin-protein ligase RNF144A n=1 Tax=Dreissena polymorpha TaxID=45954 RepID=UPI0022642A73|nr:probable E3 ubiquitin-protein ligase RNF144A [Dreissena polymorpha]